MLYLKTLEEYCQAINIPPPKHRYFDIRTFEENMSMVKAQMPAFRHEFYAIALKKHGSGQALVGEHTTSEEGFQIFFNSPYQVISWDIAPDWTGYYLIFSQEFISKSRLFQDLLSVFPFLRMDQSIPFDVAKEDMENIKQTFASIYKEHHSEQDDKMEIIQAMTYVLLRYVKRYYDRADLQHNSQDNRNQDLQLISRYQTLIEINLAKEEDFSPDFNPHATTFYADKLSIHPNYLNTIVKRNTGKTALKLLHQKIFAYSKSFLAQTQMSIKEVSYTLHFKDAAHFNNFFKKYAKQTPQQYRDKHPI